MLTYKYFILLGAVILFSLLCSCAESFSDAPISESEKEEEQDQFETIQTFERSKEGVLKYFGELIERKQVLVGQHCGDGPDQVNAYYDRYVKSLADKTGKYVGLIGGDLGWYQSDSYPVSRLIDHWNDGGLVTLSWHADNPFTSGYNVRINSVDESDKIDFKSLVKSAPESEAKTNFRKEVELIARALVKLKNSGVTVIWRPFHEMNGDFFWWGIDQYNDRQTNVEDFKLLWEDLYITLVHEYDLDNLIWVYSAIPTLGWNAKSTAYYPGSEYVDLVGVDHYGEEPAYPNFNELSSFGKTMVLSEAGPIGNAYGNWDEMELVNKIKGKAAYFLQWHSWTNAEVAIVDNLKADEMMNSEVAVTLDEL